MRKHILLYDGIESGHHKNFVIYYAKELVALNCSVSICFPNAKQLRIEFNSKELEFINFFDHQPSKVINSLRFKSLKDWKELNLNIKSIPEKIDFLFIMWLDDFKFHIDHPFLLKLFLHYLNFKIRIPWVGINVHQVHFRKETSNHEIWCRELITNQKYCLGVGIFDEGIVNQYQTRISKKIYLMPDITNSELKKSIEFKKDRIIVLPGVGHRRKGILNFLRASQNAKNSNWQFILLGEINWSDFTETEQEEMKLALDSENVLCTGYIENENEMNNYIADADLVFAVYENFPHSSNILTKAAIFKKFVLVSKGFLMAERVNNYKMGLTVESDSDLDLNYLFSKTSALKTRFDDYSQLHSMNQLRIVLQQIVK